MPTKHPFSFEDWLKLASWNFPLGIGVTALFLFVFQLLYQTGTDAKAVISLVIFFGIIFAFIQLVNLLYLLLKKMNTHVVPVFLLVINCMFFFGDWSIFFFSMTLVLVNYSLIIFLLKK